MPVADVEMRSNAKRPIWDVDCDTVPAWMPAFSAMLDSKLDTKLSTDSSEQLIRFSGSVRHGWTNTTRNLTHSVNFLKTSKSEVSLLRKTVLTAGTV